ncbi:uncharacterized protein LOC114242548 [Bombyx mandarina]|uniref:Uncharacterized protein LOC114242548 n=1 Tax=Bombyx mandarina TaxID=7092 RepID=A0A6J2JMG4_BOMMA|nr:uncharacterized protein LOC114242548 [Bombyx mandarina]
MYRYLLPLLCLTSATPAPQSKADITYFKLQPVIKQSDLQPTESRIENLPLTIPGNASINNVSISQSTTAASIPAETTAAVTVTDFKSDVDSRGAQSNQTDRRVKEEHDLTTADYETTLAQSDITEKYVDLIDVEPVKHVSKFVALSKFGGRTTNHIETSGKRRFRSRCRCEKIWNCPKLQISVPRCPEEQFLCCF